MKKFFFAVALSLMILVPVQNCAATDIWIDRWENDDIYIMDETIMKIYEYTAFSVSVKKVYNGQLKQITKWTFGKNPDDGMWRYETSEMDGLHTTAVLSPNKIFEFCMKNLGWNYKIDDMWYY